MAVAGPQVGETRHRDAGRQRDHGVADHGGQGECPAPKPPPANWRRRRLFFPVAANELEVTEYLEEVIDVQWTAGGLLIPGGDLGHRLSRVEQAQHLGAFGGKSRIGAGVRSSDHHAVIFRDHREPIQADGSAGRCDNTHAWLLSASIRLWVVSWAAPGSGIFRSPAPACYACR